MDVLVTGALVGAVLGLVMQAHWMIVLAFRPPAFLASESARARIGSVILLASMALLGGSILFAALLALVFNAVRPEQNDAPLLPSAGFFLVIAFIATFVLIPVIVMLRSHFKHLLFTYVIFLGLCGILLPNLVIAVQD